MLRNVLSLKRLFDFKGRATRREFLLVHVLYWVAVFAPMILETAILGDPEHLKGGSYAIGAMLFALTCILALAGLVALIAVAARRLHDQGNAIWFLLLGLVPVVGWLFLLVMMFYPGQPYENECGPDPREEALELAAA